jgi:hypothetical protein
VNPITQLPTSSLFSKQSQNQTNKIVTNPHRINWRPAKRAPNTLDGYNLKSTNVSEEHIIFIFIFEEKTKQETSVKQVSSRVRRYPETSVDFRRITWCIPEDRTRLYNFLLSSIPAENDIHEVCYN